MQPLGRGNLASESLELGRGSPGLPLQLLLSRQSQGAANCVYLEVSMAVLVEKTFNQPSMFGMIEEDCVSDGSGA